MTNYTILEPLPEGQWFIESQELRSFVATVREISVHAVKTTSQSASVSIYLLGNDTGCVLHHQFIRESQSVKCFRSGYSNAPCKEEEKEHAQVR
ncbi:hypothetical protein [Nostoc sp.]|uniref:hypothetical protein n=1 Tax=Nostoc sp. TaxID=1180 RepID=UPI002FF58EF7